MGLELVPKPSKILRDALGDEVSDALIEFIQDSQRFGNKTMIELSTEKYERRLAEETGKLRVEIAELRAEMHAGFGGVQEQFKDVYKAIFQVQESVQTQTKWIVASVFGAVPFYIALYKLL
ncbi:LA_3696 family protein [Leptospira sarikeiensis]|uniref:DUF1640 domain-containing protein n=1 Tax=Leptospira sarikeiensis TaxID=2484943 RepID=A0A4R9K9K7_9LEPT|nr:hypothetical protein [Leptospira sarikeiensis]TGL61434.1 hypothetical protein EHQ64_10635 [Leptospira sarikeiensis]